VFGRARWRLTLWFAAALTLIIVLIGAAVFLSARRMLFDQVARTCVNEWPNLYQDFVRTQLPDGTGSWKPRFRSKV